ncbi:alpha/beta fold hydrolase [Colwellia sp. 12G3]|uniref:alpha/beta fold hydrolase n=1 Tax=Colwellia sp. 12G3 TaxID=2058299 RepID=UPI000C339AEE|nr:alpha/beta hydrolase [Colwellia sp. 12G3]PKI16415.1 alpha/beta hydrolase [Colwellia sp. 12G3]
MKVFKNVIKGHKHKSIKQSLALIVISVFSILSFHTAAVTANKAPQDQMIKLTDNALHMMSLGEGEFTVIFESGFGNDLSHWRLIAPQISTKAKVVIYSRAGYGKSDPIDNARTLVESTNELQQLISQANLKPPFIFVGHSYGSHIIRTYAAQNPAKVAGLVFVDPANEKLMQRLKQLDKEKTESFLKIYEKMVPKKLQAESKILMAIDEKGALPDFGPLPNVPAVILTSMVQEYPQFIIHSPEGKQIWRDLHTQLFNQFSNASHIVTTNSGHNIALNEPELVIESINDVIKKATSISKNKHLAATLIDATKLINSNHLKEAETTVFELFSDISLKADHINTLGYKYLARKDVAHNEIVLASLILKYNVINNANSANVFDSYGESLLALAKPIAAKEQFLIAIKMTEKNNKNHRALKGYKANLAKAEQAINE